MPDTDTTPVDVVSSWFFNDGHDNHQIEDMLNDDIAEHGIDGYGLVGMTPVKVPGGSFVLLHFRRYYIRPVYDKS